MRYQEDGKPDPTALIIAKPGRKRDILITLLKSMPRLDIIEPAGGIDAALALQNITDHRPALVVIDATSNGNGFWTLLRQIKTGRPNLPCLVLVNTSIQQQWAAAAHADKVLVNGFSVAELLKAVEDLLARIDTTRPD